MTRAVLALLLLASSLLAATPATPLFDGRTLAGWQGDVNVWRVENDALTGEIVATAAQAAPRLTWDGMLHDFELTLEFRVAGSAVDAHAGLQFRSYRAALSSAAVGNISELGGTRPPVERGTRVAFAPDGRRWSEPLSEPVNEATLLRPAGEWNSCRISARASHVEFWINDALCAVLDDRQANAARFSGPLALFVSGHASAKVQFRNLRLADLGRTIGPSPVTAPPTPIASITPTAAADGRPLALSFESNSLANWTIEGDAWAGQPVRYAEPDTPRRRSEVPSTPVGNYWIGTHPARLDVHTGRLISAPFHVTHRWASFLISGGGDVKRTRVEVVRAENGEVLHAAAGQNSSVLRREVVDLGGALGASVFVRLVDDATEGPSGWINFDDFVFHDREPDFTPRAENDAYRQHTSPALWHLQPNPAAPSAVANTEAQKLVRGMMLTPGFHAELIATEPDVHQPIAFAIDERARLWIAEAYSYPTKQPAGQGRDRIIILEDRDGNGTFETRKVFAEELNLVSALEVGHGGVWVGAAPELLFIPDRDRDDRPDGPPQVLLDGWGFQDTHETLNSFTWGPDGWLYGCQGVFTQSLIGKPGASLDQRQSLRAGVWRYHPVRHEFEIFAHGGSNQWGLDFNGVGHLFMTHCRSFHAGGGTTHVIRNGHFWNQANSDYAPFIANRAPPFAPALKNFLPSSARYDSGEGGAGKPGTTAIYGGHSHVGMMIYLGDNWPAIYRDRLFTLNLHGHQMNQQSNVRRGSGYETFHAGFDLMFAPHRTFVGVDLQYGPDGAVYLIDWSDHQHCHTPRDDAWERGNGRIYRMAWAETWRPAKVNLATETDAELVVRHQHRSEWFVRTARRLLHERAATRAIEPGAIAGLRRQAMAPDTVEALRALWTLHVIGGLGPDDLRAMITHADDVVRAWGVQLATERAGAAGPALPLEIFEQLAVRDPSPTVRLALASALPTLPPVARWNVGTALARRAEDATDRFLPKMIWFGLAPLVPADPGRALALAEETRLPALADSIAWFAARTAEGRAEITTRLARAPERVTARGVQMMAFSLESETRLPMPSAWTEVAARFSTASGPEATAASQLSVLFGDTSALARTRDLLANRSAPLAARRAALALLSRAGDRQALPVYLRLLDEDALRAAAIPLLTGTDDPAVPAGLLRLFPRLNEADRAAALATLTSRPAHALALLRAAADDSFDRKHLTALHVRQLRSLRDTRVDALLDQVWGKAAESSADTQATIARLRKTYNEAPLWAYDTAAGQPTFQRLCASCHKLDGHGGTLGPDLTGSWRNGLDYFLENIVDPDAVVGAAFQLTVITKTDGSIVSGTIERETETTLVVRTAGETLNIPKREVKGREVSPRSLMPPGLLEPLTNAEKIELLKFLTRRR